jgi:hypothetical protein
MYRPQFVFLAAERIPLSRSFYPRSLTEAAGYFLAAFFLGRLYLKV